MEPFTLHDLRRTARTHLASLGVQPHIAERCLNHKLPGINDTYDTYDYLDERRAALELWERKLLVLEAMKMEHALTAPFDGTVAELNAVAGAQVQVEAVLVKIAKAD